MIVVGGCYRELCEQPYWDETFGSGGRAAAVIAGYSDKVRLKTYFSSSRRRDLYALEAHGVTLDLSQRDQDIAFSYLHPLGEPCCFPTDIIRCEDIRVEGQSVLRFGFVEGDAIVAAEQAVYDPQNATPTLFSSNGSRAERLAIVLNQTELSALGRSSDVGEAATRLLRDDQAEAVIVKCGVKGAWVYTTADSPHFVPPYRSKRIFKIGTGDVFSGVFAYYWCELKNSALEAATAASKAVSYYAETRSLRIIANDRQPQRWANRRISVVAPGTSLTNRGLRDEARAFLIDLGAELVEVPPALGERAAAVDAVLVMADADPQASLNMIATTFAGAPVVIFGERGHSPAAQRADVFYTDDFTTAIYHAFWVLRTRKANLDQTDT